MNMCNIKWHYAMLNDGKCSGGKPYEILKFISFLKVV